MRSDWTVGERWGTQARSEEVDFIILINNNLREAGSRDVAEA